MDNNFTNLRAYCLTLANLLSSSVNPDGTLVANSVGTQALQAAAVTLANLNPSLLYSVIPVDSDTGTFNAYAITARGGAGGTNIVPPGATYDANGNYALSGLTLNYGYYWTQGATNDASVIVNGTNSASTLSASGAFAAITTSVTLTGTPLAVVTATVAQSAPISAYKNGQMFFVWTARSNTGPATLNVNNIGAVPILLNAQPLLYGNIQANSLFVVVYMNGAFNLLGGGGGSSSDGGSSVNNGNLNFTVNGTTLFSSGQMSLAALPITLNHGLGVVPNSVSVVLTKTDADANTSQVAIGQSVPIGEFQTNGQQAKFVVSYDSNVVTVSVTAGDGSVYLAGQAITAASWAIVINATKQTNVTSMVLPAVDYLDCQPSGAISYNGFLFAWNYNGTTTGVNGRVINLTNNETQFLAAADTGKPDYINAALFTRAVTVNNNNVDIIFTSNAGIYRIPAVSPNVNVVPQGSFYGSDQTFQLTITAGQSYKIYQGTNDIAYSFDGTTWTNLTTTPVVIPNSNTKTTLYLQGNANGLVTAAVYQVTGTQWQPTRITTAVFDNFKPVWITESGGQITNIYVVASGWDGNGNPAAGTVNNVKMLNITASTNSAVDFGVHADFTNASINNISQFNLICPAGASPAVTFFAYNPLNSRIYLMTNNSALLHIFQLNYNSGNGVTNDITAWWQVASGTAKYNAITYIKSMSVPGSGNYWGSNSGRCHISIEINQQTGNEVALIFTRQGLGAAYGSITRVPWVE